MPEQNPEKKIEVLYDVVSRVVWSVALLRRVSIEIRR